MGGHRGGETLGGLLKEGGTRGHPVVRTRSAAERARPPRKARSPANSPAWLGRWSPTTPLQTPCHPHPTIAPTFPPAPPATPNVTLPAPPVFWRQHLGTCLACTCDCTGGEPNDPKLAPGHATGTISPLLTVEICFYQSRSAQAVREGAPTPHQDCPHPPPIALRHLPTR